MVRTLRAETRIALLCAVLGADVDPSVHVWTFRLSELLSVAVALIALYIALEAARGIGRSLPWIRRAPLEARAA